MKVLLHKQTGEDALLCPSLSSSLALGLGSTDSAQSQRPASRINPELGSGPWFSQRSSPRVVVKSRQLSDWSGLRFGTVQVDRPERTPDCMMWFSLSPQDLPPLGVDARAHRRWLGALLYAFQPLQPIHPLLQIRQDCRSAVWFQELGRCQAHGTVHHLWFLGGFGLPATVISTVQTSTSSLLTAKRGALSMWCDSNHDVPSRCELGRMVSF